MDLAILDILYKCSHISCAFCDRVLSCSIIFQGSFTLLHVSNHHCFSLSSNFLLHGNILYYVSPFIRWWTYVYHFFTIMSNMYINIHVHDFIWPYVKYIFSFLLHRYCKVKLLGNLLTLCLITWGTPRQFSNVAAPYYILSSNSQRFQFLHMLVNICYCLCYSLQPILRHAKSYLIMVLIFISFSLLTSEFGNHFYLFYFFPYILLYNWHITGISLKYTPWWFDTFIYFKMIFTTGLVNTSHNYFLGVCVRTFKI